VVTRSLGGRRFQARVITRAIGAYALASLIKNNEARPVRRAAAWYERLGDVRDIQKLQARTTCAEAGKTRSAGVAQRVSDTQPGALPEAVLGVDFRAARMRSPSPAVCTPLTRARSALYCHRHRLRAADRDASAGRPPASPAPPAAAAASASEPGGTPAWGWAAIAAAFAVLAAGAVLFFRRRYARS
jgi:hypothetical protein